MVISQDRRRVTNIEAAMVISQDLITAGGTMFDHGAPDQPCSSGD
jgi:hypothetical protein